MMINLTVSPGSSPVRGDGPRCEDQTALRVAKASRDACVDAALLAYEDAGIRGLCAEGRWEVALDAIRGVDLSSIVDRTG